MKNKPSGLYIHIPFCVKKCDYCGFYSQTADQKWMDFFLSKIENEMDLIFSTKDPTLIETIFIGGGNPTCIGLERLERLIRKLETLVDFSVIKEFSIETNPETLDEKIVDFLRNLPGIRISMGVQRLSDKDLTILGRAARLQDVFRSAELICNSFQNFSFDFIMGVPSCESIAPSLKDFLRRFPAPHISAYFLTLEPGSVLEQRVFKEELSDPDNIGPEELYEVKDVLQESGFFHYEISNYAKPGFECKHNLGYWHNEDYFALGPSGVATLGNKRISNPADLSRWATFKDQETEVLTKIDQKNEFIMLRLRLLKEGLNLDLFKERFGTLSTDFLKALAIELENGNLIKSGQNIRLSEQGIAFANSILSKFFI